MTDATAPIIDEQQLAQLEEELEDQYILGDFLRNYLNQLEPRIHRLDHALSTQDRAAWTDAVLSLQTSSTMAGATALAQTAASLQQRPIAPSPARRLWPQPEERIQILAELHAVAGATRDHLTHYLQHLTP